MAAPKSTRGRGRLGRPTKVEYAGLRIALTVHLCADGQYSYELEPWPERHGFGSEIVQISMNDSGCRRVDRNGRMS